MTIKTTYGIDPDKLPSALSVSDVRIEDGVLVICLTCHSTELYEMMLTHPQHVVVNADAGIAIEWLSPS